MNKSRIVTISHILAGKQIWYVKVLLEFINQTILCKMANKVTLREKLAQLASGQKLDSCGINNGKLYLEMSRVEAAKTKIGNRVLD